MTHNISFPGLGLDFTINRVAFSVLGKEIYWYGIIICIGFLLSAAYMGTQAKRHGVTTDQLTDCLILCVPIGVICARIYYVVFQWEYYRSHLSEIIAVWRGGIAIYGAIIGIIITLATYSRYRKISFLSLCDVGLPGIMIGQSIGRWGNFINAEAHGGATNLPWGMVIDGAAPVHPTFFYESLWNFIGFLLLHWYAKRQKFSGELALLYVAWYGLGRVWIEGLRTDSLMLGAFRVSQIVAGGSCVVAVCALVYWRRKSKKQSETVNHNSLL